MIVRSLDVDPVAVECCDCHALHTAVPEDGYCTRCRSGVLRAVEPERRPHGVPLEEGTETCDAS